MTQFVRAPLNEIQVFLANLYLLEARKFNGIENALSFSKVITKNVKFFYTLVCVFARLFVTGRLL